MTKHFRMYPLVKLCMLLQFVCTLIDNKFVNSENINKPIPMGREISLIRRLAKRFRTFDPEENGMLLHEYYRNVREIYPNLETYVIKRSLKEFGDLLDADYSAGRQKGRRRKRRHVVDRRFNLHPKEKEIYETYAE